MKMAKKKAIQRYAKEHGTEAVNDVIVETLKKLAQEYGSDTYFPVTIISWEANALESRPKMSYCIRGKEPDIFPHKELSKILRGDLASKVDSVKIFDERHHNEFSFYYRLKEKQPKKGKGVL